MGRPVIAGIVLAGGAARRMGGVDKATLEVGGVTLLDRVLGAARPVCGSLVVVGPRRATGVEGVVFIQEPQARGGPVPAVAAALEHVGDAVDVVVLLAADLPLVTTDALATLVSSLHAGRSDASAALDERGRATPLCAAYRTRWLRASLDALGAEQWAGSRADRLLPGDAVAIDLGPGVSLNVNCPADLERARSLL